MNVVVCTRGSIAANATANFTLDVNLPAQMVMQVRDGQVMFCKVCGRLLYMRPEAQKSLES